MPQYSIARIATHIFVPKTEVKSIDAVRDQFTCVPSFGDDKTPVPTYRETHNWFGYPLYNKLRISAKRVVDLRSSGYPIDISFKRDLRPEQIPVINQLEQSIVAGKKGFIIEAKPGFGKTAVMLWCIARLNTTALVVIPKRDIIKQWIDRLLYFTDIKREDIGIIRGRKADWKDKKVIIALVQSLGIGYLGNDFKLYPGQVWFDEVHASVPPRTYAPVACQIPSLYRGGASATPERFDNMHEVFERHFQHVRVVGEDKKRLTADVVLIDYNKDSGKIPEWCRGMQRRGVLITRLARNNDRNQFILSYLKLNYRSGRRQIVLSDRKYQLHWFRNALIKAGVPGHTVGLYTGDMSEDKLDRNASACTTLLATYKMLDMATDIPDLEVLAYATPRSDPRQSKGRLERKLEGKRTPVIEDFCDPKYAETRRWERSRVKFYQKEKCKIKRIY